MEQTIAVGAGTRVTRVIDGEGKSEECDSRGEMKRCGEGKNHNQPKEGVKKCPAV